MSALINDDDDKIHRTIQAMLKNRDTITEVLGGPDEYYFSFKKHALSILKRTADSSAGNYILYIYPAWQGTIQGLMHKLDNPDSNIGVVGYSSGSSNEMSFAELYSIVKGKYLNVDQVLDDILEELGE